VADVLFDTDVFVDHLRGARRLSAGQDTIWYSVVTRCELFAGSRVDEDQVGFLLSPFIEAAVDRKIAQRAGRLKRLIGTRIADALIAATALEYGFALVTRNVRHFERIPDLRVQEPSSG
jgi:toxin FitB